MVLTIVYLDVYSKLKISRTFLLIHWARVVKQRILTIYKLLVIKVPSQKGGPVADVEDHKDDWQRYLTDELKLKIQSLIELSEFSTSPFLLGLFSQT